ncbi:hypothetical protein FPV67DRAFT_1449501 [Lyophyllum atratum]|nr:hypothetical protein FPV67DRAFT_1449501 [Lyophyllum atratum]
MALSVSGFPEPLRQPPVEDAEPSLLALRGLFGKKPESKPLSRQNTEAGILPPSPSSPSSTPRTSQMLASHDEQAYIAQMALHNPEPLPPIPHQRPRQISLTRRTPPPVKRQPSLGRLEIGSSSRGAASGSSSSHALPKPPTVVVQEWSTRTQEPTLAHPRPLPAVPTPGPIVESSKSAAMRVANTHRPPTSKVLMTGASRPRAATTAPHAVSVRYQAMAVDPTESQAGPSSSSSSAAATSSSSSSGAASTSTSSDSTTTAATTITITQNQSQIRPLPRIPPASAVHPSSHLLPPHVPRPARVKRPKTSPSSSAGFGSAVRSPFDAVPSSWASRPVDLNPSQPVASSSTAGSSSHASSSQASTSYASTSTASNKRTLPTPRPRSHSRSRRDHSADALASGSGSGSRSATSPIRRAPPSRLPGSYSTPATPTIGMSPPGSARRTSTRAPGSGYNSSSPTSSPRVGHPPPNRFLANLGAPSTAKIDEESASIRSQAPDSPPRPSTETSRALHEHPPGMTEPFVDDQDHSSVLSRSPSPMRYARPSSRGSFSDEDFSDSRSRSRSRHPTRGQLRAYRRSYRAPPKSVSRSPSPIAYAKRNSLEADVHLDADTDMDWGLALEDGRENGAVGPGRRHTQPRSYQFDYKAAQEASPFVRGGVEEVGRGKEGREGKEVRKSAGSGKSGKRSKSKSSSKTNSHTNSLTHSISTSISGELRPSRSRSPRRSRMGTPTGSVIDISSPTTLAGSYHDLVQEKEKTEGGRKKQRGSKQGAATRSLGVPERLRTHMHKERTTNRSVSGIPPEVWGGGGEENGDKLGLKKKAGAWREFAPLRRGSEPWVGVGVGQVYADENANTVVVAAIQRG